MADMHKKSAYNTFADIDAARCSGCGWCIAACKLQLLGFEKRGWTKISALHDSRLCTGCNQCAVKCPIGAITLRDKQPAAAPAVLESLSATAQASPTNALPAG